MTETEYAAFVRYLRSARTLSEEQVEENERSHHSDDFTADERHANWGV